MELRDEKNRCSIAEYLTREGNASERHEYRNGEIVAMSGGSLEHSRIAANVGRELGIALKGAPCGVQEANFRFRIPRTPLYFYPDVSVICGEPQFDPQNPYHHTALNPRLIVEVLSPFTEAYDRGEKFRRYRQIDCFEEYVLIAQSEPLVETYFRQPDGNWLLTTFFGREAIAKFRSLDIQMPLLEIYARIDFPVSSEPD